MSGMLVLAIDTATTDLVAGLVEVRDGQQPQSAGALAERVVATRSHNELLVPTVVELLAEAGCESVSYTHLTLPTNREV